MIDSSETNIEIKGDIYQDMKYKGHKIEKRKGKTEPAAEDFLCNLCLIASAESRFDFADFAHGSSTEADQYRENSGHRHGSIYNL